MARATKRMVIDIERFSVSGEKFPTYRCKRCNPRPTRRDKINEDVLALVLRSAFGHEATLSVQLLQVRSPRVRVLGVHLSSCRKANRRNVHLRLRERRRDLGRTYGL